MKVERAIAAVVLVTGLAIGGTVLAAGEPAPLPMTNAEPPSTVAQPAPSPVSEQDQMMANWKMASTPGLEHKVLESFVGSWTSHVKMMMDPSQPPQESDGTAEGRMVLGGRFVHVVHKGTMMGQPFEGMMLSGYDNIAKKYVSTWVDNMSTAIVRYEGSFDKKTKRLMMGATFTDPMTLKPTRTRSVTAFVGLTGWTYEEFGVGPDGKERLIMSITFKKA